MAEEVSRPGSENNPHLVDTPPRPRKKRVRSESNTEEATPGSSLNPLPVADSPPRPKRIYRGPPSTIRPDPPAMAGPLVATSSRSPNLALEASLLSEERERERGRQQRLRNWALMDAHRSTAERALEPSRRGSGRTRRLMFVGRRELRATPLRLEDLYVDGTAPPDTPALYKHHECSICHFVKAHPVS
ncbi:hypothetical protein B0H14DRAFT_3485135 [Mycena olivaceomarginata]|nr:hypothetical protein B0H14DRAFT_3485135 [Mycena olivaceomarginata]